MQLRGSTVFALALDPPVRADATAATLFAPALDPPVRADGAAATRFADALLPAVLALRSLPVAPVAGGRRAALPRRAPSLISHRVCLRASFFSRVRAFFAGEGRVALPRRSPFINAVRLLSCFGGLDGFRRRLTITFCSMISHDKGSKLKAATQPQNGTRRSEQEVPHSKV